MDNVANFAISNLSAGIDSLATTITLVSGGGGKFPSPPFNAVLWNTNYGNPADDPDVEIVRVTAISGDSLTVIRGQEGTTASAHNTSGVVYRLMLPVTAKTFDDISAHINSKLNPHNVTAAQIGIAINLKDYGAVGDGTTDDTTAIENAINDAVASHRPLYIPYGTYLINKKIIITDNLDIISNIKSEYYVSRQPILSVTSGFTDDAIFETQFSSAKSLIFEGILFSFNTNTNVVNVNNSILFSGAVKFIECGFTNVNIIYNGMTNDGGIEFYHCYTQGSVNQIAQIYQTHSFIFRDNFMAANSGIIFSTSGGSHESVITNNIIVVINGRAIYMQDNYNDVVVANVIRAAGSASGGVPLVELGNSSAGTSGNNIIVANNAFDGGSVYTNAVKITHGYNNVIVNNVATHFTDDNVVDILKESFIIEPNKGIDDNALSDLSLNKMISGIQSVKLIDFQTYDMWETAISGSGSILQQFGSALVRTGTTANSYARQNTNTNIGLRLYSDNVNAYRINVAYLNDNTVAFVGLANVKLDTQTDHTLTALHAGLFYDNGQFYASSSDGTTQTLTPVSIASSGWLAVKNDGTNIKFYWNGDLIATHPTANIYGYAQMWINDKGNGVDDYLYVYNILLKST